MEARNRAEVIRRFLKEEPGKIDAAAARQEAK
jgi:hypothetical protein